LLPKKGLDGLAVAILLFTGLLLRPAGNKEDARTDDKRLSGHHLD
jgi:hypothetical protein